MPPGQNPLLLPAPSIPPEPTARPGGDSPLHPPSRVPAPPSPGGSPRGDTGSVGAARGAPARRGEHRHSTPHPGRAGRPGESGALPASARYRKEPAGSSALRSCQERELKVRPRSQLRPGVAGAERSCCVSALQNPGSSSRRGSFARHFLRYPRWREAAVLGGCPCRRAPPAPSAAMGTTGSFRGDSPSGSRASDGGEDHGPAGLAGHGRSLCSSPPRIFWNFWVFLEAKLLPAWLGKLSP